MINKDVGRKIGEIRKSLKLTQSQFAELVNLSEDGIGKIERCATIPKIDTIYKIASALKLPIEDLLSPSKKDHLQKPSQAFNDFMNYLQTRSPEDVMFIHELAVKIFGRKQ